MKAIKIASEETVDHSPIGYIVRNEGNTSSIIVSLPPQGSLIVEKSRLSSMDSRLKLGTIFGDGQYSWNIVKMGWTMLKRHFSGESLIGDRLNNRSATVLQAELQAPPGQHIIALNMSHLGAKSLIVNKSAVIATTPNISVSANLRTGLLFGDVAYRLFADGRSSDYIAQSLTHDSDSDQDGIIILAGHGILNAYELGAEDENKTPGMGVQRGGILAVTDNINLSLGFMGTLKSVFFRKSALVAGKAKLNDESCENRREGYVITQQRPAP